MLVCNEQFLKWSTCILLDFDYAVQSALEFSFVKTVSLSSCVACVVEVFGLIVLDEEVPKYKRKEKDFT